MLEYPVKTEENVSVAGKTWKYRPGTVDFNPRNYHKINIVGIVDRLNEGGAWQMDNIMSAEDHQLEVLRKHVNNKTIKQYGEAEVAKIKVITKAIKEPQGNKAENRPATPPIGEKKEKISRIGQRAWQNNYNPINRQGDRPEGFGITISDEAQVTPQYEETTIVMLATATMNIKLFKGSTYNRILANTTIAEIARKQG